jgi:hypothetical protein
MEKKTLLHYVYYRCTKRKGPCSQRAVRVEDLESQINRTLARFNVSEQFVEWALDTMKDQTANEAAAQVRIDALRTAPLESESSPASFADKSVAVRCCPMEPHSVP